MSAMSAMAAKTDGPRSVPADLTKPKLRILLLTPYTGGNLGDAAIQDAVIHHLRKRLVEPQIRLVTLTPGATTKLHGLPSFPIQEPARTDGAGRLGARIRRMGRELRHWLAAFRLLKETDLLVMSGGGQIDDFWGGPMGHPYALFKWASMARLCGARVVFLSVGVCSLRSRLGRGLAYRALRFASYRSYRDHGSKELLREAAFTRTDPEYPDLAFSYPCAQEEALPAQSAKRTNLVVGISPMVYQSPQSCWPESDAKVYEGYLQTLCEFAAQVLEAGHTVVLFTSSQMDRLAVENLQAKLRQHPRNASWGGRLRQVEQTDLNGLLEEIRELDLVVASRLHGIILSHLLGKPALAVSYDRKVRAHAADMGQERFCLDLIDCTSRQLWDAFSRLSSETNPISAGIRARVRERSQKLAQQYDLLVQLAAAA
ncbi:MAG TPA: polysaccharide pyruvyl transferase family protein [Candidatus Cybelea sp.]|jgi:polysaccharide pyruvyl transferase WcaK-like protein|nr:polysaccharide pyruvyl transferase family protein [Candidatus Cybelea sp.]